LPASGVNVQDNPGVEREMTAMAAVEPVTTAVEGPLAFTDAYPRLFGDAYRVGYRLLGDRTEAEDVAAETCARAYSRWRSITDYAEPWCVRVAGNLSLDLLRARVRVARRPQADPRVRDEIAASDDRMDLVTALSGLPRRQRETVILRFLGDQSEEQTAALLGMSVGSVKTHASRGLHHLREVMAR
jgi:RNA polymerase sigma factor (sigma-70 family)